MIQAYANTSIDRKIDDLSIYLSIYLSTCPSFYYTFLCIYIYTRICICIQGTRQVWMELARLHVEGWPALAGPGEDLRAKVGGLSGSCAHLLGLEPTEIDI